MPLIVPLVADVLDRPRMEQILGRHRPQVIFHLAAIVSGEAEAEFDKGYRINLDGTRHLLEAIRAVGPHEATVRLEAQVQATLKLDVVAIEA